MSNQVAVRTLTRVVPKANLDRPRFNPLNTLQGAVSILEVPQQRIKPLSEPSNRFWPAFDLEWAKEQRKVVQVGSLITGGVDTVLGLCVVFPLVLTVPESSPIVLGIWAALQSAFLPFAVIHNRVRRGEKRNFNSFLLWLQGRYNITLSSKQGIPSFLRKDYHYESQWFVDSKGRQLHLRRAHGLYVTPANSYTEFDQSLLAAAPKKVKSAATQLSAEARALFEQINAHLLVLSSRNLSPESEHVVERAARDRDKVVALHADLVHLGIERVDPSQEEAIIASFTTLLAELTAVVGKETKFALDALSVETSYVSSRKERKGISIQK